MSENTQDQIIDVWKDAKTPRGEALRAYVPIKRKGKGRTADWVPTKIKRRLSPSI